MRKGIPLQILIIFLLLLVWNVLHLGYRYQKISFENSLSEIPIILIANEQKPLIELQSEIDSQYFIDNVIIEPDSVIAQKLFKDYGLLGIENVLSSYNLPSVMKIFLNAAEFNNFEKTNLEKKVTEDYDNIILHYDHKFWQNTKQKIQLLTYLYYGLNILLIFFSMFFLITLRMHNEAKSNQFWKVYYSSGGSHRKRFANFWFNSFLIILIPILLFAIVYLAALYLRLLPFPIFWWKFVVEFGVLVFIILFSRLATGKELK